MDAFFAMRREMRFQDRPFWPVESDDRTILPVSFKNLSMKKETLQTNFFYFYP